MRRTRFHDWPCSVARTVDLLGDWWTPLVLRECFYGVRRFDDFQGRLGIGRNVLTERLGRLVGEGLLAKVPYQERPVRHEYRLTDKGRDFFGVIAAMLRWGDDWLAGEAGPPVELRDRRTGAVVRPVVVDEATGERLDPRHVTVVPGPGLTPEERAEAEAEGRFAGLGRPGS
jgi:DNA-binding HxlR family transcriptional regulator